MILLFLTLVWVGGGLALGSSQTIIVGTVISLLFLGAVFYKERTLIFPRYFLWSCALVLVALMSVWWSRGQVRTLESVLLTASGILWWVGSRTLSRHNEFGIAVKRSVLIAGGIFTMLWVINTVFKWPTSFTYGASSLVVEASFYKNHNHLGDWWMVMLVMCGSWANASVLLLPGMVMIWIMRSRSSLVGLVGGWGYVVWAHGWFELHRKKVIVIGLFLSLLFVGLGMGKGTFESRDYYVQTIAGLVKHPIGVGLANFEVVSMDLATHWWGRKDFSSIAHSLPLEWIAGMGWLGFVGWIWLGLQSWHFGFKTSKKQIMWRAAYWAILINFLLDTTYFIPSMWILWCVVMGLAEQE